MANRDLKVTVDVDVHVSAYELAEIFWAMDAEEQAGFFHRLGEVSEHMLPFQLQSVTDSKYSTPLGRHVMASIGEYAPESTRSAVAESGEAAA